MSDTQIVSATIAAALASVQATLDKIEAHMAPKAEENYVCPDFAHLIGKTVWIRTVTMTNCGTLAAITPNSFLLTDAVWVANTGLWHKFCQEGVADEVESMGPHPVSVGKYGLIDAGILPRIPQPKS